MRSLLYPLLSAFLIAPSAEAALVSYNFTASIVSMYEWNPSSNTAADLNQSNFPGYLIDSSWTISGNYQYDTQAPVSLGYQPAASNGGHDALYRSTTPSPGFTYSFGGGGPALQTEGALWLEVVDQSTSATGWDVFYTRGQVSAGVGLYQEVSLSLYDQTGTVYSSAAIPSGLALEDFHLRLFNTLFIREDGSTLTVTAVMTSLSAAEDSSVPEPATLFLAGIGIFLSLRGVSSRNRASAEA